MRRFFEENEETSESMVSVLEPGTSRKTREWNTFSRPPKALDGMPVQQGTLGRLDPRIEKRRSGL